MRRRSKAFSLLEILMAVGLSLLLVSLAAVNAWPARTSASSRSLADSLAEELRLAGRSAIASGVPVAVALPTGNGGPHSQSLYCLAGQTTPQLTRVRSFQQEFPGTYLCVGTWGRSGAGAWTRTQPKPMSNSDTLNPATWTNPIHPQDPMLIFTPAGTITSNGWPLWNGAYHLVASQGVQFRPESVPGLGPGLAYFSLQRLAKPWTVRLSAAGAITLTPGLLGSDGTTALEDRPIQSRAVPAPPVLGSAANSAPLLVSCQTAPQPPVNAASGTAVLAPGDHLSLRVTASDPEGDRIFCRWAADGGDFSSSTQDRVELEGGLWVSNWEWRPPAGATSGDFHLTCTLTDAHGASTTGGAQGSLKVKVESGPSIIFGESKSGMMPKKLKKIHLNGSGEVELAAPPVGFQDIKVAANGDRLLYGFGGMLFASNADGTGSRVVSVDTSGGSMALWMPSIYFGRSDYSPQGTRVVFPGLGFVPVEQPSVDLYITDVQGGSMTRFTSNNARNEVWPLWSGDDRLIVFTSENPDDSDDTEIMVKLLSGGAPISLSGGSSGRPTAVDLCPSLVNGNYRLLYRRNDRFRVMDFNAAGAVVNPLVGTMSEPPALYFAGKLSKDGSRVVYQASGDIFVCEADGSNSVRLTDFAGSGQVGQYPMFTPDGNEVVYFRPDPTGFQGNLHRVRVDGSLHAQITRNNPCMDRMMMLSGWDIVP